MNKREEIEAGKRFLEVYCGILFNAPTLGFDFKSNRKQNADFMLKTAIRDGWGITAIKSLEKRIQSLDGVTPLKGSTALWNAPI